MKLKEFKELVAALPAEYDDLDVVTEHDWIIGGCNAGVKAYPVCVAYTAKFSRVNTDSSEDADRDVIVIGHYS